MKHLICILVLILCVQLPFLTAQEEKKLRVAVFDPSGSVDEGSKVAVRELISSTFVNTGKYTMVERSQLNQVMKEHDISNSALVDDSQATEIGRLAGANKVVLSVVTLAGSRSMLSIKSIDVKTATIDLQKTKVVDPDKLLETVEPLTLEMLGEEASAPSTEASDAPKSKKRSLLGSLIPKIGGSSDEAHNEIDGLEKQTREEIKALEAEARGDLDKVLVEFAGMASNKNPEAKIFVDGKFAGEGTFNGGFSITFVEKKSGKHEVSIEWENAKGIIDSEDYKIDTRKKRKFTFECIRGKKRYELIIK
ncbi:MAG: CsgG/HfaB family protein [Prevotellaceae bacterium]|jgi:hypothetical protein|nr:CsgG/HfaB family protein [Prevotellaceae bacterium]